MTSLSPSRARLVAAATVATLAFGATGAVTAQAGSQYSPAKCQREVLKLERKYGSKKQTASDVKKLDRGINALIKHHRCKLAG